MPLILLLLTACQIPKAENKRVNNQIQTIIIDSDTSMVNPMLPKTNAKLVLDSNLTLLLGNGKKINISKAKFNKIIKDIKFVDLTKLKDIKHPPTLGGSYKTVLIKTDKGVYGFSSNKETDYPVLIGQLAYKINQLIKIPTNSNTSKWQKLKLLKDYSSTDFNLKEGVEYLEIRTYFRGQQESEYHTKQYKVIVHMERTPLSFFEPKLLKEFKKIVPNLSKESNLKSVSFCLMRGCTSIISNGFMIDEHKKMWVMNTTEDILNMIGDVDTPAEVKLVLWLNDKKMSESKEDIYKYLKSPKGYKILHEYDNSLSNLGECGHFTYEMFISKKGKIIQKKLLKKSESKKGCLAVD